MGIYYGHDDNFVQESQEDYNKEPNNRFENPMEFKEKLCWFWNKADNPLDKDTKPIWEPYNDLESTIIEMHFVELTNQKFNEIEIEWEKIINDKYKVRLDNLTQISLDDEKNQRQIRRGLKSQRSNRPSNQRHGSNDFAHKKPKKHVQNASMIDEENQGSFWLGSMYLEQICKNKYNSKLLNMKLVIEGIVKEQSIWYPEVSNKNKKAIQIRDEVLKSQSQAWNQIFECHNISQEDIKEIMFRKHSAKSDKARAAILKIYSYETNLYPALNEANQTRDRTKIKTLGPYAFLLMQTLLSPPKLSYDNWQSKCVPFQWHKGDNNVTKKLTVFRGLGLTQEDLEYYKQQLKKQLLFQFNGYTSTSFNKKIAEKYAKIAKEKNLIPTIFIIDLVGNQLDYKKYYTSSSAYLKGESFSAFHEEDEVLIGLASFKVKNIQKNKQTGYIEIHLREFCYNEEEMEKLHTTLLELYKQNQKMKQTENAEKKNKLKVYIQTEAKKLKDIQWFMQDCNDCYHILKDSKKPLCQRFQKTFNAYKEILGFK